MDQLATTSLISVHLKCTVESELAGFDEYPREKQLINNAIGEF